MINKVILMGRLVADPELRQTPSGASVCRIRVAVPRQYASKDTGERQSDFINVTAWRQTAEFIAKYFAKGKMIIVEGSLRNNDYTDQNGVKHYSMEVQADNVTFGESKGASGGNYDNGGYQPQYNGNANNNGGYQNNTYYQNPSPRPVPQPQNQSMANESLQIGNLDEFEVLNDGDIPF